MRDDTGRPRHGRVAVAVVCAALASVHGCAERPDPASGVWTLDHEAYLDHLIDLVREDGVAVTPELRESQGAVARALRTTIELRPDGAFVFESVLVGFDDDVRYAGAWARESSASGSSAGAMIALTRDNGSAGGWLRDDGTFLWFSGRREGRSAWPLRRAGG